MRIAISDHAILPVQRLPQWHRWRGGDNDTEWLVWRAIDPGAPLMNGTREIFRNQVLPVSRAEIDAAIDGHLRHVAGGMSDDELADWVRHQRGDPSHDWYAWVAPLRLTFDEAGNAFVDALELPKTTHSCIVLRPCHSADGWFAWLGLGSMIETVAAPLDMASLNHRQKRAMKLGRPIPGTARFSSREAAREAALALIRTRRAELVAQQHAILEGWASEVFERLAPRNDHLISVVGTCQLLPISIRDGPAKGDVESWNLPIVETIER